MSKGRRSQARKGQQEMANGNRFSMLQEDDDQFVTPNGGRDGRGNQRMRVQAAGDGSDESDSPAQDQGSYKEAVVEDDVISELGSQFRNVTVNVQIQRPAKLKSKDSEMLQKVLVVQRHWQNYWNTGGRQDNGAAVWEDATLNIWGARLTDLDDEDELLMKGELEQMNGEELFETLVAFLRAHTKNVFASNLDELNKMKQQLKWDFQFGTDYPGWASVCRSMNEKLQKIAGMFGDDFKKVKDDESLANAFLNTFHNARLRVTIKNEASKAGKSKNIYGLYKEARKIIKDAGTEECNDIGLSVGVSTLIGSILMNGTAKTVKGKREKWV